MANIYDTAITVYRGVNHNPDGTVVPFSFCTAFFDADDDVYGCGGEYLIAADEDGNLIPVGTVGNAATYDNADDYPNYCAMMLAERRMSIER